MNAVSLIGRLCAAPERRDVDAGTVTNMRLAIGRPKSRDGEERGADYVDIAVWGAQAAPCHTYLAKGRLIAVQGRLHHREWTAEDGSKHSRLQVIADNVEFLDAPRNGDSADSADSQEAATAA